MSGEIVQRADLQFGLLHRGSEKLCEARSYSQVVPYMDRMDYVANLFQEHAAVASIESLDAAKAPTSFILTLRLVLDELSRVLNHLLTMSAICLDLGAMGPIFWAFEEREMVMEIFERISGARMHTAIYRPFDVGQDFMFNQLSQDITWLISKSLRLVSGAFLGLLNNRAFRSRCAGIGIFSAAKLRTYGVQGVIARSSGLLVDSRLGLGYKSYGLYRSASVVTYLGTRGDCYDRFIVRCRELLESFRLVSQFLNNLEKATPTLKRSAPSRSKFVSMESTIEHFKRTTYTPSTAAGLGWSLVEGPKGGVSVLIVHSGSSSPHRLHVRSPVAHNLYLLGTSTNGYTLADFVSTFCSMDVVLGEIDR